MSAWVAGAVVVGAVVGAVASTQSAKKQAEAQREAMTVEERIAADNLDFQKEQAEQQRADFAPWRDAGETALKQLESGVASGAFEVGKVDVTQDPGYQFRLDQGVEALDKSAAARGRLLSGAQQKGVTDYSQNLASNEYANAYARESSEKSRQYNMLSSLSQAGQSSAAGQAQASSQLASSSGNIMSNLGQSQSAGIQNIGQIQGQAYTDTAQSVNQAAQNWLTYKNSGAYAE